MNKPIEKCTVPRDIFQDLKGSAPEQIPSEVLNLLIEEIRVEEEHQIDAYNRYHNRHNRSR